MASCLLPQRLAPTNDNLGLEVILYQTDALHQKITAAVTAIREDNSYDTKSIINSGIGKVISDSTGMKINFNIDKAVGLNACVYMPPIDNGHVLWKNWFAKDPWAGGIGTLAANLDDPSGSINRVTGKVSGLFTKIPVDVFVGHALISYKHFTPAQVSAIIIHELGHAFSYFYYLGTVFFTNFVISRAADACMGVNDVDVRTKILHQAERTLGVEVAGLKILSEQPNITKEGIENIFINSHRHKLYNATGTDMYDFRSCEQLADEFASLHGAGADLASALYGIHQYGSNAIVPPALLFIVDALRWLSTIGMIGAFLTILVTNPAIQLYDRPKPRLEFLIKNINGIIKDRKLPNVEKQKLLASIEHIKGILANYNDYKGLDHLIWTTLSPAYRRGMNMEAAQKLLEGLMFNDLYAKAAQFDSMESLNPYLDPELVLSPNTVISSLEAMFVDYDTVVDLTNRARDNNLSAEDIVSLENYAVAYGVKSTVSTESISGRIGYIVIVLAILTFIKAVISWLYNYLKNRKDRKNLDDAISDMKQAIDVPYARLKNIDEMAAKLEKHGVQYRHVAIREYIKIHDALAKHGITKIPALNPTSPSLEVIKAYAHITEILHQMYYGGTYVAKLNILPCSISIPLAKQHGVEVRKLHKEISQALNDLKDVQTIRRSMDTIIRDKSLSSTRDILTVGWKKLNAGDKKYSFEAPFTPLTADSPLVEVRMGDVKDIFYALHEITHGKEDALSDVKMNNFDSELSRIKDWLTSDRSRLMGLVSDMSEQDQRHVIKLVDEYIGDGVVMVGDAIKKLALLMTESAKCESLLISICTDYFESLDKLNVITEL